MLRYKTNYEILGTDRNSYSKTDIEATFMRMKDDHMMNGQLKPAYLEEQGILNRQIRSIQTEGHFGDIKENDNFRRFNYRSLEKVYKEFLLYAIDRNINKYHRFIHGKIKKFEGKSEQQVA